MMMRSKMRGLSMWGWLFVVLVVFSVITLAGRLAPYYFDHMTMVSLLDGVTVAEAKMSKREIRELLEKRFKVNNIRGWDVEDIIDVDRSREGTTIVLEYEVREPIVANVTALLHFREQREFK